MSVVSSFLADDIDLNRSGGRGVELLKAYLDYAVSGGERLVHEETAGDVPLNAFEADVRDVLDAKGINTRPQFGASRYRIDLVAMHPQKAGRPVLAIECDGASYHSSATARDRDRLRQTHLEKLGWRFHRIWSTDWFYRREEEITRALSAFEDAVRRADVGDSDHGLGRPAPVAPPQPPAELRSGKLRGPCPILPVRNTIDHYPDAELLGLGHWVSSDGLLRTNEELIREIFALLPFERLGGRIRERLEGIAQRVRNTSRSA